MELIDNNAGNYRFLTGIAPYSAGVVAMPGYEIVHVTLRQPLPYRAGFAMIEQHLDQANRPRQALCAIELRSPQPFSFAGFAEFNGSYQDLLDDWGLMLGGRNPIARTNIAPEMQPPSEPSLYAFSYTYPEKFRTTSLKAEMTSTRLSRSGQNFSGELYTQPVDAAAWSTFVVAGAGDLRDQATLSAEAIVRPGETSVAALREKAAVVINVMQERLFGLGMAWSDVTVIDVYTTQPIHPILVDTILEPIGAAAIHGLHWHYSHPPIEGLVFEMDLRGIRQEQWI